MDKNAITVEKVGIKYGLFLAGGLIGYFLFMKLFGLEDILELRFLNVIILVLAVVGALKFYKKNSDALMTYFKGIGVGVLTSMVGALIFALFMGIYLGFIDPVFLDSIKNEWSSYTAHINPFTISFIIVLEGTISGFFTTFIAMQYFKVTHAENPTE